MKISGAAVIVALTILIFAQVSNCSSSFSPQQIYSYTNVDIENDPAFASNNENALQRKYTILVQQKSEDCYFITDVKAGRVLTVDFLVINSGSSGQQLDISFYIRDPNKKYVKFESRKAAGGLMGQQVEVAGDYQVCFNNRYSMMQSKRVFWQYEVEGERDIEKEVDKLIMETADDYKQQADITNKAVRLVRNSISRARNNLWWLGSVRKKHHVRMEAIEGMVTRWSIINVVIVVLVGICQVVSLRALFNTKPPSTKTGLRA